MVDYGKRCGELPNSCLPLFSEIQCHVIPNQYKWRPLPNIRKAVFSHPLHGLVKRFTGTFPTNEVLVEATHKCFVAMSSMAHRATNTDRAPDPKNARAIPTTPSVLISPFAEWQQLSTTSLARSRTFEISSIFSK